MRDRIVLLVALLMVSAAPGRVAAQVRPETIRGRVTSDSGFPVRDATVSATRAPDRMFLQARTDTAGRFSIRFDSGTGDYLIHATAVGYKASRKRLTRAAGDAALTIELKLTPTVTQLGAVKVVARAQRPARDDDAGRTVGASEQQVEGVYSALAPGDEGNLAAIANAVPGATSHADGVSVLGLGGDQSNATLNGMAFSGPGLPRDAQMSVRVATSSYDPARGGFSGAQSSIELSPGSRFYRRNSHLTLDAPQLQAVGPVGEQLGKRYASVNASIGGSGELVENRWYYNNALQISRRQSDVASLLSVGADALRAAGVAPDSVLRLRQLLTDAHVPLGDSRVPGSAITQALSFVSRIDHARFKGNSYEPAPSTWNVTLYGNHVGERAEGLSVVSAPSRGGERTALSLGVQANYSRFVRNVLNDTRTGLSVEREAGTPYLRLPSGTVLVSSLLPSNAAAFTTVAFGGNGALDVARRAWTWETINETHWYPTTKSHRLKLTLSSRFDGYSRSAPEDLLGSYGYASLADLAAGQPSSFSRTLAAPTREGGEWSGFVALGDYWRATRSLSLMFGARLEGNRYLTDLAENTAIASAFGASTAHAPEHVHASPRLGFTWYFGKTPRGMGMRVSSVALRNFAPTMVLRGGIGEFRGLLAPSLLSEASVANGLANGLARLTCIGTAVPAPSWDGFLSDPQNIPTTCAGGAPSTFTDAAPTIRLFDRTFDAARSWRANIYWGRSIGNFGVSVEGVYSLNLNQPGIVDLNFGGTPKFVLADEGERPVFVSPSSIVAGTGIVSPVESRTRPDFGRVVSSRSDLRSTSRQLTVTMAPDYFGRLYYSLAYTLGDMRSDARGFDGAAFDDPTRLDRGPGNFDVRHQIIASLGADLFKGTNISLFARMSSGIPYTPRVSGDPNGDGLLNDRAFVFDPVATSDASLAAGMHTLLDGAPDQARACLREQLGHAAARNSCRGPWTAMVNARVGLYNRYGNTKRRISAALNLTNPLGGLDQLLHGGSDLRGWGSSALPDPTLLVVRGFDPAARRFRYEVNQRFGSAASSAQLARAPFRVTLDMQFDLGVPIVKQQAIKLLRPGRGKESGPRLRADSMAKFLDGQVVDIYERIMRESDSLLISRDQMDSLKAAGSRYRVRMDSLWMASTTQLAAMDDDYDANRAMHLIDDATEQAWILDRDELPTLARILSPLQMRMAPWVPALQQSVGKKSVGIRMFRF
ncbi:MAG: carboxypeptidase-like regulatory domain-containing protein [bacterium]